MTPQSAAQFDAAWLALRGPVDARSRSAELAAHAARWLCRRCGKRPARIVDLGAGAGANLRYLAPRLPAPAHWQLLDQDAGLLAHACLPAGSAGSLQRQVTDLGTPATSWLPRADLVTASALLDLASADWVIDLCAAAVRQRAALLLTLTVDGRASWAPALADDDWLQRAVARDQQRAKGLGHGAALGGQAPAVLLRELMARGYGVMARDSSWRLGPGDCALTCAWLRGWQRAALQQQPERAAHAAHWLQQREHQALAGRLHVALGHVDVLALPPAMPRMSRS